MSPGLFAAAAVDAAFLVHLHVVEAGMVEQAEGGAEGAEEAAVGAGADQRRDEEGAEVGGGDQQVEAADEGDRPGVGRVLRRHQHADVVDEE
jgi:hypothetical protein